MISTDLWASVPFKAPAAMEDFAGMLALYHHALADHIYRRFGQTYRVYPIGDPGGPAWLGAVQRQYEAASAALGIAGPPDLSSYNLEEAEDHASFFFTLSTATRVLASAARFV